MGIFPDAQGQLTHKSLQNFEPMRDFMDFLVACKKKEDPIRNEDARVVTTLFNDISDAQEQITTKSVMDSCPNLNSFELLWLVLLPARRSI